jgi:hypothetical protein
VLSCVQEYDWVKKGELLRDSLSGPQVPKLIFNGGGQGCCIIPVNKPSGLRFKEDRGINDRGNIIGITGYSQAFLLKPKLMNIGAGVMNLLFCVG